MLAVAGDLPGYEDATRALFANDRARLEQQLANWPSDVGPLRAFPEPAPGASH